MKMFLLITILILIVILVYQEKGTREFARKTFNVFKIVCKNLKQNMEDR